MFRKDARPGSSGRQRRASSCAASKKTPSSAARCSAKPGTITPHTKAKAKSTSSPRTEGGRSTSFFSGYRPQFYFRTTDVTGVINLPDGVEMVMPGDNLGVEIELGKPIAMEKGQRFAIREGGRTIGAGRVTEVIA